MGSRILPGLTSSLEYCESSLLLFRVHYHISIVHRKCELPLCHLPIPNCATAFLTLDCSIVSMPFFYTSCSARRSLLIRLVLTLPVPKLFSFSCLKILKPVKICQLLQLFYLRFYCLVICFVYFLEFFQMFFTCISKVRSIISLFFKVLYLESNKLESHDFLGNILFCFYNNASNVFRWCCAILLPPFLSVFLLFACFIHLSALHFAFNGCIVSTIYHFGKTL